MNIEEILKCFRSARMWNQREITQLKHEEDGAFYQVWRIDTDKGKFILKEAKAFECELYETILSKTEKSIPVIYEVTAIDNTPFLLMEYIKGEDLCKCSRRKLIPALDALISLQKETWANESFQNCGYTFEASFASRIERSKYLNDMELEIVYAKYLERYASIPRALCHDDLLPFNVIVSEDRGYLIDWEYGGILPYPTSIARLIAHGENMENALFYMTQEDKAFAIEYYYENLLRAVGISYEEWVNTIELFLFYEYCEWVFVGNKYGDTQSENYTRYYLLAKQQARRIIERNT